MASFYIPLTGLNADSTALNTIANNLSNMNTTGYKSQSVNFSDLVLSASGRSRLRRSDPARFGNAGVLHRDRLFQWLAQYNQRGHERRLAGQRILCGRQRQQHSSDQGRRLLA